ncbi:segregation protein B [Mycoplasma ovis str. Michigan]|uniref:Segregation protein B n=1 Tax=Mycoplasma ovis str. Michigan TaxID=1415773 RepID=A0ABN4BKL8_9MOLU|nr:segregation protein B [Mycoplasma ovis str. Michigan]
MIYFDNATTSLKLPSFIEKLLKSYSDTSWVKKKEKYLFSLVKKLSNWLNVLADQILLVPSSTYAINEIFNSIIGNWNGQILKVYIFEGEHISNWSSLWNFKEINKELIEIHHYSLDKEIVNNLQNEQGILLITFRDNLGNCIWAPEEISKINQRNKELIIIGDLTQSMMNDDISKIKEHFDYLYFSAHKVLGPFGIGCIITKKHNHLRKDDSFSLDWRSIYVWEQEFDNILRFLKKSREKSKDLVNYWVKNFPISSGFSYIHYPNSLIFLVKVNSHSIHDFAYLLEECKFVFRFNDLCSSNSLLANKSIMRFSLSPLNKIEEIEKLFELMKYFQKTMEGLN